MTPKHDAGRHDTRPLNPVPDEPRPDSEALDPRSRLPAPGDRESAADTATETGFVAGFRTEAEAGDEPHSDESPEDILGRPPAARDVAAELAAPPRRRLPLLTLALGAGVFASVGFLAGVEVQKDHGGGPNQAAGPAAGAAQGANPYGVRAAGGGAAGGGAATTGGQPGTGRTGGGTGGTGAAADLTTGTVKVVDDSFIYVSDSAGNIVKVKTDADTRIQVVRDGKTVDLKPGDAVVVRGATGADGSVTATSVTEGTGAAGRPGGGFAAAGGGAGTGTGGAG
ncbi:DUF5666 domain-containing protein [Embleya scabrispora]|uniref:DUF5666 domain-containing protein n=1 Tax=Embleya scabrispora TaxID=159449 RepID=UPI00037A7B8C|nr:DUF5666 domain-containing protein [Embleya scabrispora]MYS83705.1 hypothetical protein [Streptomyces sp. SID5474]